MKKKNNTRRNTTLIRVGTELKDKLKKMKVHPRETYEDIIQRLIRSGD